MKNKKTVMRGVLALAALGLLTALLVASPVGAAKKALTKAKARKVATKQVNKLTPGIATGIATGIANSLAPRAAFGLASATIVVPTADGLIATATINAPGPGILVMDAGGRFENNTTDDEYNCLLRLDGTDIPSSIKTPSHDGVDNANEGEDCTTEAAVPVNTGSHTVEYRWASGDVGDLLCCSGAVVWVLWVPFDGNGNRPTTFPIARQGDEIGSGGS